MPIESILIASALAAAAYPLLRTALRGRVRAAGAAAALFGIAAGGLLYARESWKPPSAIDPSVLDRPTIAAHDDYVSSSSCRSCHPSEYASWHASYHRTMTQEALPGAVAGDFDDVVLTAGDWVFRLERRGDEFWTITEEPGEGGAAPKRVEKPVVMTTGSHHYQVYWLPDEKKGVLRAFPFVFLLDEHKWIPRKAAFLSPPSGPRAVEKARWNNGCAKCHSLDARWRPVRPKTDTQVAELGIACEACHGPALDHVRANRDPTRRYLEHWSGDGDATVVQPERLTARRTSDVCGQCHSISRFVSREDFERWAHDGYAYRPGDALPASRDIVRGRVEDNTPAMQEELERTPRFVEDSFWSDGHVRIAGREYNGLLESPCYQRGEMTCLSCHRMHHDARDGRDTAEWADDMLDVGMRGNRACVQCHADFGDDQRVASHTQHRLDSSGSNCMNCHMPYTTYGLLKAIRSHTIDSPSVQASLATGRPNACNQCHLDKTLAWTARQLEARYGIAQPVLSTEQRDVAASLLWLLSGHAGQRALAAWSMGWAPAREVSGGDWMAPYLAHLLVDPYDSVRWVAYRALRRQPGFADFAYDSLAPPGELQAVSSQALARWTSIRRGESLPADPAILIGPDGALRRDAIRRLAARRDDRPVVFRE